MRHIFDQYSHTENRLTHALAVSLNEDRALLIAFLRWLGVNPPARSRPLRVDEQTLPGERPVDEDTAERRGLPDLIIHDGERWCLLIESKVEATATADQLCRHERTVSRRGFTVHCVLLTKDGVQPPAGVTHRSWSRLYEWLGDRGDVWGERLRSYLRVAEQRLIATGKFTEGTLTMFDGFKFTPDEPYTAGEGRRLLKLAMEQLRRRPELQKLGMDAGAEGRPAVTGRGQEPVWDFIPLKGRPGRGGFTKYPHLTLAAGPEGLEVAVTIPHGVDPAVRRRVESLGVEGLRRLNATIILNTRRLMSRGATVKAYAVQRHYKSQRSRPSTDGRVEFKLEATQPGGRGRVKYQPQWLDAFAALISGKRSNIQFGFVINLPWGTRGVDSSDVVLIIEQGWMALAPLLDVCRGR